MKTYTEKWIDHCHEVDDKQLKANISKAITAAKRRGTTAMSLRNLLQVTPTTGLTISVSSYHADFERIARAVAAQRRFPILADPASV